MRAWFLSAVDRANVLQHMSGGLVFRLSYILPRVSARHVCAVRPEHIVHHVLARLLLPPLLYPSDHLPTRRILPRQFWKSDSMP